MPNKRALIVDDSRSARHILGRMLESFALEVDAVESAELALTYLQTTRPDVIFMDHLMPGMDGFAAVRVIKANPDTATIPVLMYTSQEGEMYLSQARALGAMGVLPKTLKHADVADALEHLGLHAPVMAATRTTPPAMVEREVTMRDTVQREVVPPVEVLNTPAEQLANDLPNGLSTQPSSISQWAHRIATEVHAEFQRRGSDLSHRPDTGRGWRIAAVLASGLALLLLVVVIYQQTKIQQQLLQLQRVDHSPLITPATVTEPVAPPLLAPGIDVPAPLVEPISKRANTTAAPIVETEGVPYGEVPLSTARLEHLRTLLEKMHDQQVKGVVRVEVFLGDFCLAGNPTSGYMPAEDEVLVSKCDLVGNPFGDGLTVQQRQSVAFANLVSSTNSNVAAGIKVQLADGAHRPLAPYPPPAATLTAGAWNRIAERNQRVEFMVLPAS